MLWHNLPQRATNSRQEQNKRNLHTQTAKSSPFGKENKEARQQERKSARYISNSAPQRTKVSECKHPKLPKARQRNTTLRFLITHRHNAPFGEENKEARQQEKKSARCTRKFSPQRTKSTGASTPLALRPKVLPTKN